MGRSVGGAATACERIPTVPAVYAWFRGLRLDHSTPEAFVTSVCDAIATRAASNHTARLGPLHKVALESASELSEAKRDRLFELSSSEDFRLYLNSLLDAAALLQAPLYVGKARDLRTRTRQHLDPSSDLSTRLQDANIVLRECTLAYIALDHVPDDDRYLTLIEEILTRICRPGFVLRPG